MKQFFLLVTIVIASSFSKMGLDALTDSERKQAIDFFQKSKDHFLASVKGLSVAQLNWKADSTRWSVAQCAEHIALSEKLIWQWNSSLMAAPATPEKKSDVKITNEQLMAAVVDRSRKGQAPEMLRPGGKFPSTDAAVATFTLRRDSTMNYIRTTNDDLHSHYGVHPAFGTLDCYAMLLMLAGHSERHTLQIDEVKATPGFPKE